MSYTSKDINDLLENWHDTKQEIAALEKKCDKYKKLAEKIMIVTGDSKIESSSYSLSKRKMTRYQLTKQNVPKEIWDKYSVEISYPSYYLKQKK
jgi:hypothetical protein